MKRQFELLESLHSLVSKSKSKISALEKVIEKEQNEIKKELINLYPLNEDVFYLVKFNGIFLNFYKVTKLQVLTISIEYYHQIDELRKDSYYCNPKNLTEAEKILNDFVNVDPSTVCCREDDSFGYFHDIERRWNVKDWLTEKVYDNEYLYEVTEEDWVKAVSVLNNFYIKEVT